MVPNADNTDDGLSRGREWTDADPGRRMDRNIDDPLKGGLAGRPLQMADAKDEILAGLRGTQLRWQLCDTTWSIEGIFEDEPVQVVHFVNPFGPQA
jgi:hypothetical protein